MSGGEYRTPDGCWPLSKAAARMALPTSVVRELVRTGDVESLRVRGETFITSTGARQLRELAGVPRGKQDSPLQPRQSRSPRRMQEEKRREDLGGECRALGAPRGRTRHHR